MKLIRIHALDWRIRLSRAESPAYLTTDIRARDRSLSDGDRGTAFGNNAPCDTRTPTHVRRRNCYPKIIASLISQYLPLSNAQINFPGCYRFNELSLAQEAERQTRYARCAGYIRCIRSMRPGSLYEPGCSALQELVNTIADTGAVPRARALAQGLLISSRWSDAPHARAKRDRNANAANRFLITSLCVYGVGMRLSLRANLRAILRLDAREADTYRSHVNRQ